jgi:hypothetical protein
VREVQDPGHRAVTDVADGVAVRAGSLSGQFSLRAWQAAAYLAVQMSDAL